MEAIMSDAHVQSRDHPTAGSVLTEDRRTGEHLARGADQRWAVVADVPERQGVTGHNVRYVLLGGLAGALIGMTAVLLIAFH
jgi:hypothetical protein